MEQLIKSGLRRLKRGVMARLGRNGPNRARDMEALFRQSRPVDPRRRPVLFWMPGGMPGMHEVEGTIAAALKLRGIPVHAILCDGTSRACVLREKSQGTPIDQWQNTCAGCRLQSGKVLDNLGIPYSFTGDYVPPAIRAELAAQAATVTWDSLSRLTYHGVNLEKNVRSAVFRYLRGEEFRDHEELVREYALSALVCAAAAEHAIEEIRPERVFTSHGIYTDWGPALQVAMKRGLPVIGWMGSYLPWRFFFRRVEDIERIDFHNLSAGAWATVRQAPLTPEKDAELDRYLSNRYTRDVSFDMKEFKTYLGDSRAVRQRLGVAHGKPVWGLMCHMNWDCVSDFSPMAYASFNEWVRETLREVCKLPEVEWFIKVHPVEAWENPETGVQKLVEREFPSLPPHVHLLGMNANVSPLDFFQLIDGAVTVYGTSGLETAIQGKPVILAGEAHYGQKGFTHEGLTQPDYIALLRRASSLGRLTAEQLSLARRYAYCYFIERQIPLEALHAPESKWSSFQHDKRHLLLPGADPFVDFVCQRILDGKDFIMNDALVAHAETMTS